MTKPGVSEVVPVPIDTTPFMNNAHACDSVRCPIALAINAVLKPEYVACVGTVWFYIRRIKAIGDGRDLTIYHGVNEIEVAAFIDHLDGMYGSGKLDPFKGHVNLPAPFVKPEFLPAT
jgi:hypothetical protein